MFCNERTIPPTLQPYIRTCDGAISTYFRSL